MPGSGSGSDADAKKTLMRPSAVAAAAKVAVARTRRPIKAAIEITDAAAARLKELLASKSDAVGIRVGVKSRGCNGDSYTMSYVLRAPPLPPASASAALAAATGARDAPSTTASSAASAAAAAAVVTAPPPPAMPPSPSPGKREEVVVDKGVTVFIDPGALIKIVGTRMDWKETDEAAEFVFDNPNAKAVCGCGESFKV